MATKKVKSVRARHQFYNTLGKILVRPILHLAFGFKVKGKYKIQKGERVIVLSNHQANLDPIFVEFSFNKHLIPVGTDTICHGLRGKLLKHCFGFITKRKGETDIQATAHMTEVVKEGGNLLFFPEGNRSYAEFQFFISPNLPAMLKNFKSTIILYNLHGGTGCYPRWKGEQRIKGNFYGEIKRVLKYDEYKDMSNEELYKIIVDNLRVFDSESGEKFHSKYRAQYLEKMLFVCPKCGGVSTLKSKGVDVFCSSCGLKVEYTEDLHLKSNDPDFKFHILNDWYQFQKKWMLNYEVKENSVIFQDRGITCYLSDPNKARRPIYEGKIILTDKELVMGSKKFALTKIAGSSPISGLRFSFTYDDHQYVVVGKGRFNPLKYVLAFHKLDTKMKREDSDRYFTLED